MKTTLLFSKIYQILQYDRLKDKEQLTFWKKVLIQNRIRIKSSGSKTTFEFGPNLLEVQTYLENLINSLKFIYSLTFQKSDFRLAWFCGKS
jgi:hypothetical protein